MKHLNSFAARALTCAVVFALTLCFAGDALAYSRLSTATVVNINSPPVAENLTIETYRGIPVSDSFRSLDPEGDLVSYAVSKQPKKGSVDIDGDIFTYTPAAGKKGKDSFTYVAVDSVGNVSDEAVVNICIRKQTTSVSYSDMDGENTWYAATALAEKGVFTGEMIGSRYFFRPASAVTRGEFLVMCMELCGAKPAEGLTRTGFYDDGDILSWQKPYVAAALMNDIISGYKTDGGQIVFSPSDTITAAEASVMLNNSLGVTDVAAGSFDTDACPVWASQAVMNLSACGVVRPTSDYSAPLTRADAAELLLGASGILSARE